MKEDMERNFNCYGHGAKLPVDLDKDIENLEKYLGVNTDASRKPTYFAFAGLFIILLGLIFNFFIVIGIVLEIIALVFAIKKGYTTAYKWNRSIVMYIKGGFEESLEYLEKLPKEEKMGDSYSKMRMLLKKEGY